MITVIYAIFACGTIATLQRDNSIATRVGRRGMMLGAVGTIMVADGRPSGASLARALATRPKAGSVCRRVSRYGPAFLSRSDQCAAGDQDNPVILTISPGWLEVMVVLSP